MLTFLTVFGVAVGIITIVTSINNLNNDTFWLLFFWFLITGVYIFSGVRWVNAPSISTYFYIATCLVAYLIGRLVGIHRPAKTLDDNRFYSVLLRFEPAGYFGVTLFVIDFLRLNGLSLTNTKSSYQISMVGSLGAVLAPILFVAGLYRFARSMNKGQRISLLSFLELGCYSLPCVLNNGREALMYILIALIALYSYYRNLNKRQSRIHSIGDIKISKVFFFLVFSLASLVVVYVIYYISYDRFGANQIQTYLNTHTVSLATMEEANSMGRYQFLYYNILSYFGHQLPFLELIFAKYNGPYLGGLYELNIISRRLPAWLNLNYLEVYQSLNLLFSIYGESFNGAWQTIIGSLIIDFGRSITLVICILLGFRVGVVRNRAISTDSMAYAVLNALICCSMFTTIQLGPFYNVLVYGTYIWWHTIMFFSSPIR